MTIQYLQLPQAHQSGHYTGGEINYHHLVQRGRRLQSEAMLAGVLALKCYLSEHVIQPWQRWNQARNRYNAFMALDNLTLKDIGVYRSDIRAISEGTWHDERSERNHQTVERHGSQARTVGRRQQCCNDHWSQDIAA